MNIYYVQSYKVKEKKKGENENEMPIMDNILGKSPTLRAFAVISGVLGTWASDSDSPPCLQSILEAWRGKA